MATQTKNGPHVPEISKEKVRKIWAEAFTKSVVVNKLPFKGYLATSLVINIILIALVLLLINFKKIPPEVPLFYGSAEGQEQLAPNWQLILPALGTIVFVVINTVISYTVRDEFLKKTLIIAVITLTFLSVVTTLKIIDLVGAF